MNSTKNTINREHKVITGEDNSAPPSALLETLSNLEILNDYTLEAHNFLNVIATRFAGYSEQQSEPIVDDEYDDEYGPNTTDIEEAQKIAVYFPAILNGSLVASACFCFETGLTKLCKYLDTDSHILKIANWQQIETANPKADNLTKAKEFLKNNFELSIGCHQKWSAIKDYFGVRNCIAHAYGEYQLLRNSANFKDTICRQSSNGIRIAPDERTLCISDAFPKHVIGDMIGFWHDLEKELFRNTVIGPVYWPGG